MAINPYTNDFMRALPAALRPNPHTCDEHVMEAIGNGWNTDDLAKACYINDRQPNPAFVVTNLRNLCKHPQKQQFQRTGWAYGHIDCDQHERCEICRCIPGSLTHHRSMEPSMPIPSAGRTQ